MQDRELIDLWGHTDYFVQHEGRYETLILAEEEVGLRIPIGAEYIKSPGKCEIACYLHPYGLHTIEFECRWKVLQCEMVERPSWKITHRGLPTR